MFHLDFEHYENKPLWPDQTSLAVYIELVLYYLEVQDTFDEGKFLSDEQLIKLHKWADLLELLAREVEYRNGEIVDPHFWFFLAGANQLYLAGHPENSRLTNTIIARFTPNRSYDIMTMVKEFNSIFESVPNSSGCLNRISFVCHCYRRALLHHKNHPSFTTDILNYIMQTLRQFSFVDMNIWLTHLSPCGIDEAGGIDMNNGWATSYDNALSCIDSGDNVTAEREFKVLLAQGIPIDVRFISLFNLGQIHYSAVMQEYVPNKKLPDRLITSVKKAFIYFDKALLVSRQLSNQNPIPNYAQLFETLKVNHGAVGKYLSATGEMQLSMLKTKKMDGTTTTEIRSSPKNPPTL